jgi:2-iminoacetate synthase ThiH
MALCQFCKTNFSSTIPICTNTCKFCSFSDETFDQSLQEEFGSLLNPTGVTQVPKYEDFED